MVKNVVAAYYFTGPERLHVWDVDKRSWYSILAVSGGGRGQKVDGERFPYGTEDSRRYTSVSHRIKKRATKGIRGGPLPPGYYKIHNPIMHPNLGKCSYLEPNPSNTMYGRDQFFIHGAGVMGSDGCIIPGDSSVFPILERISKLHKTYGNRIYLKVVSAERDLPAVHESASTTAVA